MSCPFKADRYIYRDKVENWLTDNFIRYGFVGKMAYSIEHNTISTDRNFSGTHRVILNLFYC